MSAVTGIILAGGRSRRMGRDKALMELGGRALIGRVIDMLQTICADIVLVTNSPEAYRAFGLAMIPDALPNAGSLGGLYSGLVAIRTELAIAVACDMPFLNGRLLEHLVSLADGYDAVVPDLSTGAVLEAASQTAKQIDLHPLHAVYRRTCIEPMAAQVQSGDLRLIGYFDRVRVRAVRRDEVVPYDPALRSFINVNTPDEWAQAEALLGGA
ncbi:MAG: molybdenum cofactor guanylyltransferase [Chloroflexi bacterium]|nr:molybdenum cofactor guanylyltransferase [Chloroflexota bacterium]